jgi:hypothetical protein
VPCPFHRQSFSSLNRPSNNGRDSRLNGSSPFTSKPVLEEIILARDASILNSLSNECNWRLPHSPVGQNHTPHFFVVIPSMIAKFQTQVWAGCSCTKDSKHKRKQIRIE